jgi:hypothetical protein
MRPRKLLLQFSRLCLALGLGLVLLGCEDLEYELPGEVVQLPRPLQEAQSSGRQVLFGDLHVHTTYSADAFEQSLSFSGGEGAHPPADACDYARYCSQLDFWSINDHAFALTPDRWQRTKESVRQCNAVAGAVPDTVAFAGWEWTQSGANPETHYGHKNIIFPGLADDELPPRPIMAASDLSNFNVELDAGGMITEALRGVLLDSTHRPDHWRNLKYTAATFTVPPCPDDTPQSELGLDCREVAETPAELFSRLENLVDDYLVIPHGNSWGLYTPPGSNWKKQLVGANHNPQRQTMIEVYSGHGNSEEYRSWRGVAYDQQGRAYCPEPTDDYLPCCWQAGEIVRQHCEEPDSPGCGEAVEQARANAVAAGPSAHSTLFNVSQEEWLNCGVCEDCFLPAYDMRPGVSAQAAIAQADFGGDEPRHFKFGFIASSDVHSARAGIGYKEVDRARNIDFVGQALKWGERTPDGPLELRRPEQVLATPNTIFNRERNVSMLYTGGLAAVHSEGRTREEIWDALKRNEVYGTSGPRMLLWFDHIDVDGFATPMGQQVGAANTATFRARALGEFKQKPGCPDYVESALGSDQQRLCGGECFNPSDERTDLARLEIIKILPQQSPEEELEDLIIDPWRSFDCDGPECEVTFSDPDFLSGGREAAYYVRAVQVATPTINGDGLRCEYDEEGRCTAVNICYGHGATDRGDDCLAEVEHRAWSSPIWLGQN